MSARRAGGLGVATRRTVPGFALVAAAATLWGSDALFRRGLALELPASVVVLYEHLFLVLAVAPILPRAWRSARRLRGLDLAAVIVIGAGASAVATMLFTAAFRYGDPTTPLLLQKLQPVIAIAGAHLLLGERARPRFLLYAGAALAGGWLMTFANPLSVSRPAATAGALAVGAAALWGMGTVLGRHLSAAVRPVELTTLRFAVGLPTSAVIVALEHGSSGFVVAVENLGPLLLLALIPGLLALWTYYHGLRRTPASAATLAELAFPLSAIVGNYLAFGTTLAGTQWVGVAVVAGTLLALSWAHDRHRLGIDRARPMLRPPVPVN